MYDLIIPVTKNHDPIVIEGRLKAHVVLFNAGPATIKAKIWNSWDGKNDGNYLSNSVEPNLTVELRAGNQIGVSGAFIRAALQTDNKGEEFAALGARFIETGNSELFS